MERLRNLDIAKGYVELLQEIERLRYVHTPEEYTIGTTPTSMTPWSTEARFRIKASPHAALESYTRLQNLTHTLQSLQPAAEGAAPHLVDHVEKVSMALRKQIKEVLESEFEALLDKIKWPSKEVRISGANQNEWKEAVGRLLELQQV
jgi:hypothetical protein